MKKTILITGGSGYVGKNLQEYLSHRFQVLAPSHTALNLLDTKSVERYVRAHAIDVVIHAALVGGSQKEEEVADSLATNLRMFFNVVRCRNYFHKLIHIGSGAEYDKSRSLRDIKEEDFGAYVPQDPYGFHKYICATHIRDGEMHAINLRIFGLFGPHENYRLRFISNMLCRAVLGVPYRMNQDAYYDYVYIKDFVRIVEYFIEHNGKYRSYNIGTGKRLRLSTLAKKIRALSGADGDITVKHKGLNKEYTCNNTRLMRELIGFRFTDLDESLKELFAWYKRRKSILQL